MAGCSSAPLRFSVLAPTLGHMADQDASESVKNLRRRLWLHKLHPFPRMIVVGIVGGICFIAGIIMIFTPGPAVVFIPLGLLLLASEFAWAERWAKQGREKFHQLKEKWRARKIRRAKAAAAD